MNHNDIELVLLLVVMAILFLVGLRKREKSVASKFTGIDLPMSQALKGIACVLILMGHYAARLITMDESTTISMMVYRTTANVALALFMYFSGYGLSVKKQSGGGYFQVWWRRMKKVYLPLLLVCVIAMVLYAILPTKFTLEESESLQVSKDIWYLHNFSPEYLGTLIYHILGWKDWYVFCIIIFYSFFYLSQYLSRKNPQNQTWILWLMFIAYYVFAYWYFGQAEAHWYRYCWAFFLGHIHGKMVQSGKANRWDVIMLAVLLSTIFLESRFMKLSYAAAIIIVIGCVLLNKRYTINSKSLAFMGSISYFFYLSHGRISGTIMAYSEIYSVTFWVFLTILFSFLLQGIHASIEGRSIKFIWRPIIIK